MNFEISHLGFEHYTVAFLIANIIAIICTIIILLAVLIDFILYHKTKVGKREKKSLIETGTMFIYFVFYCLLLRMEIGRIHPKSEVFITLFSFSGSILIIAGCYFNVMGRIQLKHNWANQVVIYYNHTHITNGVYRFVRHPLYSSLIWMLTGGSLIYIDYIAFISVLFVFLPMMFYRARQEEEMLASEFSEYSKYRLNTGMFFPKIFKKW